MMSILKRFGNGIGLYRGAGHRLYLDDYGNGVELPDKSAEWNLLIKEELGNAKLECSFGYISPSGKEFTRSLPISLDQAIAIRNFLNQHIESIAVRDKFFYFLSYDHCMLLKQIKGKASSVEKVFNVTIKGYKFLCNKPNGDGSAIANLYETENDQDVVWAVLYRMTLEEKLRLDKVGGLWDCNTEIKEFSMSIDGRHTQVYTNVLGNWFARNDLKPFDWYMHAVIEGAVENQFPAEYITYLENIEVQKTQRKRINKHINLDVKV